MCFECVVCISTFCSDEVVYSLQCGHVFHEHCLQQLTQAYLLPRCPLCRSDCFTGIRRLFFGMAPNATSNYNSSVIVDNHRDEVKQKTEIIQDLEEEIATIERDHNERIEALETKLKKMEKAKANWTRDLKIAKEKEKATRKENKKFRVENSQLSKKIEEMVERENFLRNDKIMQYQGDSSAKANSRNPKLQLMRKTEASKRSASLMANVSSSTTSLANLNPNQLSMKPRLPKRSIGVNVVKEMPSSQKGPIRRRVAQTMSTNEAALCAQYSQTVNNGTAKRGRMVDGEFRPLRNR